MRAEDFVASLDHLELSVAEFAAVTGEDVSTVASWTSGAVKIPRWVDALTFAWEEQPYCLRLARLEINDNVVPLPAAMLVAGGAVAA